MDQFTVYRNRNPRTRGMFPLFLDVQSDLLEDLETRVVIPMTQVSALKRKPISTLTPVVKVEGGDYLLLTPQLFGIARAHLGAPVTNIAPSRKAIMASLDMLVSGI